MIPIQVKVNGMRVSTAMMVLAIAVGEMALGCDASLNASEKSAPKLNTEKSTVITDTPPTGRKAPGLDGIEWISPTSRHSTHFKGKVTVIRWWTAPYCPYCKNSAPALNFWHSQFEDKGLNVIGLYHHKSRSSFTKDDVTSYANNLGFKFPVGIDHNWLQLKKWWLNSPERRWTSVTFVIDKMGMIRAVHPGGDYKMNPEDADFRAMHKVIRDLLHEGG